MIFQSNLPLGCCCCCCCEKFLRIEKNRVEARKKWGGLQRTNENFKKTTSLKFCPLIDRSALFSDLLLHNDNNTRQVGYLLVEIGPPL